MTKEYNKIVERIEFDAKSHSEGFASTEFDEYAAANQHFLEMLHGLETTELQSCEHEDVENFVWQRGIEVLRLAVQGHFDSRARKEVLRHSAIGADGIERNHRRSGKRQLTTIFGDVEIQRIGYGQRECNSLFPADEQMNLPEQQYSHAIQRRMAESVMMVSFDESVKTVVRTTGGKIPKYQMQSLTAEIARNIREFYDTRETPAPEQTSDPLILTTDAKGIVMIKEALREHTRKAADQIKKKLQTRLTKGEKGNRKRMAQAASVYSIAPYYRTPEQIISKGVKEALEQRPKPRDKRVWASVERSAKDVIDEMFQEALRRDPDKRRQWVILIDGQAEQLRLICACLQKYKVKNFTIVLDFVHVIEYLWKAAYALYSEGSSEAEAWVKKRALAVLNGKASSTAAGMKLSASKRKLSKTKRKPIDTCAQYLLNHSYLMRYDEFLKQGFPIATGVIEGACRHLINDRMGITGARWGLRNAEAILALRSLNASGDFDEYWTFHKTKQRKLVHTSKFADIPWKNAA